MTAAPSSDKEWDIRITVAGISVSRKGKTQEYDNNRKHYSPD